MSKFHITPILRLYNAIQFANTNNDPSVLNPESAGLSLFYDGTGTTGGALYVSVRTQNALNNETSFEYRPMINMIEAGTGIKAVNSSIDPGKVTISLNSDTSDSSVIFKHIECTQVNANGCCYAQINGITDSGFVYRAYKIPQNTTKHENIDVNCYPYSIASGATSTTYLAIDFDSSVIFNNLLSGTKDNKIHLEVLMGSAAMGAVIIPTTTPGTPQ